MHMKYTLELTYLWCHIDCDRLMIHILGLFNQMFTLTHIITTVSDMKRGFDYFDESN